MNVNKLPIKITLRLFCRRGKVSTIIKFFCRVGIKFNQTDTLAGGKLDIVPCK